MTNTTGLFHEYEKAAIFPEKYKTRKIIILHYISYAWNARPTEIPNKKAANWKYQNEYEHFKTKTKALTNGCYKLKQLFVVNPCPSFLNEPIFGVA